MGLFNKKKKEVKQPKEIEVAIRKVKNEDGEKYMHIGDFINLLEQYQEGADLIDTRLLQQLIDQLKTA
jgi:hypothetical protein